jgi:HlyD family secretion protein
VNKKAILPIAAVAAIGGFTAWRILGNSADPNVIRLSGNIELTQVDLSFKTAGRISELNVDEGTAVTAGQVISRLESAELQKQIERERAGVDSASSSLVQLRTAIQFQSASIDGDVALRRAELAAAESRLQEMLNGSRPQELETAKAMQAEAQTQHDIAQRDWERAQRLYKNDDISTSQYDQFKAKFDATAATLKRAKEQLNLVKEGPRKEQIDQQRSQVERARAALKLSEANRIDLKRRQEETTMRQAEIARAEAQTGALGVQMNDRTLISPINGVVLTKSAERGEVLAAGATVVTLGEVAKPWVRGYVGEKDLGRVKLGMPAWLSTDSFPGKKYEGKITFISSEAEFTPKQIQTYEERQKLVYRIKIEVPNPKNELKLNMPVDAEIRLQ